VCFILFIFEKLRHLHNITYTKVELHAMINSDILCLGQGDQVGQIFALVIVNFGQFF
jgi:hypothetical protein